MRARVSSSDTTGAGLPRPGRDPRAGHGRLLLVVEIAQHPLQLAHALDVEFVKFDAVPAASGPGQVGPELWQPGFRAGAR